MTAARRTLVPWVVVGALFVAAGLRDMSWPGFLTISPRRGTGVTELVAGLVILTLALVGWARRSKAQPR
jgi:hypothetical protein